MELSLIEIIQEGIDMISITDYAKEKGVKRPTIYNWIEDNHIDYIKIPFVKTLPKNRYSLYDDDKSKLAIAVTSRSIEYKGRRK
jgi:predicted DNA-binding transcriptional regulator AlpA